MGWKGKPPEEYAFGMAALLDQQFHPTSDQRHASCTACSLPVLSSAIVWCGDVPFCPNCVDRCRQRNLSPLYDDLGGGD